MNYVILGAASFIGQNLLLALQQNKDNNIIAIDRKYEYFSIDLKKSDSIFIQSDLNIETDYDSLFENQDVVYHLLSTTVPTTSNLMIGAELQANVVLSANILDACVRQGVKKVIFISSGGTVYGKNVKCPIDELSATNPITSYGVQKLTIEKLLYLYNYMYDLDYRIIRLSNPYGPYQRPDGVIGAISTFTYKALREEEVSVYGDGSVIRDYIYIDDAVRGILKIESEEATYKLYNVGCGYGTSINEVLRIIQNVLNKKIKVRYQNGRSVDVPVNYLSINRFKNNFGELNSTSIDEGVRKTAQFMKSYYNII